MKNVSPGAVGGFSAALAQAEREIKSERIIDSVAKPHAAGCDIGGCRQKFTDREISNEARLIVADKPALQVARDLGMLTTMPYRQLRDLAGRSEGGPT